MNSLLCELSESNTRIAGPECSMPATGHDSDNLPSPPPLTTHLY